MSRKPFYLASVVTVVAAIVVCAAKGAPADGPTLSGFQEIVGSATEKVFPAVVFVKCLRESHESGKKLSREVAGSGVIVSEKGELITNWHVVDNAIEIRCLLHDGRSFDAEVVGSDKDLDIALLRLKMPDDEDPVPSASLGDSSVLTEGDFVMAMGAPWGMARSVSIGIVSCTRRFLVDHSEYSLWLQTDAAISPGNSGGPLVNTEGEVVGITARGIMYGGDMGFVIPSVVIREILPRLRQSGDIKWAWIGCELQPIRDFNRNVYFEGTNGVIVAHVSPNGPAAAAGIRDGDRILTVAGQAITAMSEEDLPAIRRGIALLPIGKPVECRIQRGDKILSVQMVPRLKGTVEGDELDCPRWDMTLKAINQFENKDLYFYRKEGVFVYGIKYPGNASTARVRGLDIIVKIGNTTINGLKDAKVAHEKALANIKKKSRVMITVLRNGITHRISLDFSRDYERD